MRKKLTIRRLARNIFLFLLIFSFGVFRNPVTASAATYTFVQTNWSGGISPLSEQVATNALTGWTTISTSSANVILSSIPITTYNATSSITHSGSGITQTGFNYTGASFSSTTVSGTGSSATLKLSVSKFPDADIILGYSAGEFIQVNNVLDSFRVNTASWVTADVGALTYTAPALYDIDNDGDNDIVFSGYTGMLYVAENQGTASSPNFVSVPTTNKLGAVAASVDVGSIARVGIGDVNHDGLFDIVMGASSGFLTLLLNTGSIVSPTFSSTAAWTGIDYGVYTAPTFADINRDGWDDLVVGLSGGSMVVYNHTRSTSSVSAYYPVQPSIANWLSIDDGSNTFPVFGDTNGDGDPLDLVYSNANVTRIYLHATSTNTWSYHITLDRNYTWMTPALADLDNDINYHPSGTYISGVIDTGIDPTYTTLSYSATTPTGTSLAIQLRSGVTTNTGSWTIPWTTVANGGNLSALNTAGNDRYYQYRVIATATDVLVTPTVDSITVNSNFSRIGDYLISNSFDSGNDSNFITSIAWATSSGSGGDVGLSIRTAATSSLTGFATTTGWYDFTSSTAGCVASSASNVTTTTCTLTTNSDLRTGLNDRYFQYKLRFATNGTSTPIVSAVRIDFAINNAPTVSISSAAQVATSTDVDWGKILFTYTANDADAGTTLYRMLEYSTGSVWTRFATSSAAASSTATTTKWFATSSVPNTYASAMQIRITANDGQTVNASTTATSAAFEFDSKVPVISAFTLDSRSDLLSISATDNTTMQMRFYDRAYDTNFGVSTTSKSWTPVTSTDNTELINLQVRDKYGNLSAASAKAPAMPTGFAITDTSSGGTYSERVDWTQYSTATSGVAFASYQIYRASGATAAACTTYSQLGVSIVTSTINYYVDSSLNSSLVYCYKVSVTDTDGDVSNYSSVVYDQPDGGTSVQFTNAASSGSEATTPVTLSIQLSGVSMTTTTVMYAAITASSTATGGETDYTLNSGTLTFSPGETSKTISLVVVNDSLYEGNETVAVALSSPSGATLGTNSRYIYTILDNETAPTVTFSTSTSSINEGSSGSFKILLSNISGVTTTIPFVLSGTATSSTNYTMNVASPALISAGNTSTTLTITTINNYAYSGNKTVIITMGTPTNASPVAPTTHTATIIEVTSLPALSIGDKTLEEGNSGTTIFNFSVTLSSVSAELVTVVYETSNGTAVAGSDYIAASGTLSFAPGQTSQTIPISVYGDATPESSETFTITLSNVSPSSILITDTTGTGTITNDDSVAVVQFGSSAATGPETVTTYSIPVTISPVSGETVSIEYTRSGTAIYGTDYTISSSSPLSVAAGIASTSLQVSISNDSLYEGSRTIILTLSNPSSNATLGTSTTFTYTITDDESIPSVSIANASTTEGNLSTKTLSFPVTLTGGARTTTTVNYTTANGTATAGSDYVAASGVLTFSSGQTTTTIPVTINGDLNYETDEVFTLTLSNPSSNITISIASATGTIINDDSQPSFSIGNISANEGNSGVTPFIFTVSLSSPTSTVTSTVVYATADGTATADSDYTAVSGTLTFSPAQTSKTITVNVFGDAVYEPDETFTVILSTSSGALLGTSVATGTISNDDDMPVVQFTSASASNAETVTTYSVPVTISPASGDAITIYYATSGTAIYGTDYTIASSSPLSIPIGATSTVINLSVTNDSLYEGSRTVILTFSNPSSNTTLGANTIFTYTITDNESMPSVSIADASTTEGNSGTKTLSFPVTLSVGARATTTVNYSTADGSATAVDDYVADSGVLTFSPGQTTTTVDITINGDATFESDEIFSVLFSNPSDDLTISDATGVGTIVNDDTSSIVQFSSVSASGAETSGPYSAPISVDPTSGSSITLSFTATGTATVSTNYTLSTVSPFTISANATTSAIVLTPINDELYQGDKTVIFTILSPSSNATLGTSTSFTYTITDSQSIPSVSIANASTTEGNSSTKTLSFPVTLSGGARATTTVNYSTANGSATAGDDYVADSGVLTFSSGQTSKTISVTVNGDTNYESDETFTVTLSGASGFTIGTASSTGTILNDDSEPSLSINNVTSPEGNSGTTPFTFTVTLAGPTSGTSTVAYETANGSATAGNDYTAQSGTLTFSPGQTEKTIAINVSGDTVYEPDETFTVTLSNPSGAILGTAVGIGTIQSDDGAPTLQFGAQSSSGFESVASVSIPITLSTASAYDVTATYSVTGGTAVQDTDFTLSSSTLTLLAGSTQGTIPLSVINNTTPESDKTVIITLSTSTNATLGAVQSYTYTIVNDDVIYGVLISDVKTTIAKVSWTTTLSGTSVVEYGLSADSYALSKSDASSVSNHVVYLANLSPITTYFVRARTVDTTGEINIDDKSGDGYSFTTTDGAIITGVASSDVRDTTATVTWNTNRSTIATVIYSTTSSLANSVETSVGTYPQESGGVYGQSVPLTGLLPLTTYYYKVRSTDVGGNIAEEWNSGAYYSFITTVDQSAPVISNISTPVLTQDSIVVTWQTNETANSSISYGSSTGSYTETTSNGTLGTTHGLVMLNLAAGTTYYYTITSADALGNTTTTAEQSASTTSGPNVEYIHTTRNRGVEQALYDLLTDQYNRLKDQYDRVAGRDDTTPPVLSDIRVENLKAFSADIKWSTNEPATSFLEYGETTAYGITAGLPEMVSDHALKVQSLKMGATYHFRVISVDVAGNKTVSDDYTFQSLFAAESLEDLVRTGDISQFQEKLEKIVESAMPSLVAPVIFDVKVENVTETSALITWKSSVDGSSVVGISEESEYKKDSPNPYGTEVGKSSEKVRIHNVELTNLKVGAVYHFQAKTANVLGIAGKGKDQTFATKFGKPDLIVSDIGQAQVNVKWTTERKATSYAEYKDIKTGKIYRSGDDMLTTVHILQLPNLAQDTTYEVRGYGTDERGNAVESVTRRFRTLVDTKPPAVSGVRIENAIMPNRTDRLQSIIFWKTDEPATSQIFYQEGSGKGDTLSQQSILDTDLVIDHAVILTTFKPSTVYRVKVTSKDASGNEGASKIQSILTPQKGESIIDIITRNFEQSFQWLKQLR